jgi:uncharacterized membrane protein
MYVFVRKWLQITVCSMALLQAACSGDSSDPPSGTKLPIEAAYFPCDVERIMQNVCQQCHSDPPVNGAPFPLVRYQDTQKMILDQPVTSAMLTDVEGRLMPRAPVVMSDLDRAALVTWLRNGAPASTTNPDLCQ